MWTITGRINPKRNLFRQPWIFLILSILLLVIRSIQLDNPDILLDDAFISFRYAENLANGHGLVFNPGERVEGYTNFLWTILLAGGAFFGMQIGSVAKALSAFAAVGTLITLFAFAKRLFGLRRGVWIFTALPMLLFGAMGSQARYIVSGMETLLFTFLLSLSVYLFLYRKNFLPAGLLFGLTALTRPEGILYFLITLIYGLIFLRNPESKRKNRLYSQFAFLGIFLLTYGLYFVWRLNYYGFLLPNTYYAKAAGLSMERILRGSTITGQLFSQWSLYLPLSLWLISFFSWKENPIWILFSMLFSATLIYFILIGGDFIVWFGPRFFLPSLPFLLLMSTQGLRKVVSTDWIPQEYRTPLQGILFVALLVNALWFSWPAKFNNFDNLSAQMRSWREMGVWMSENLPPDTKVATDAVGLIPFYSQLYTIDMFGLTDVHIAHLDVSQPGAGIVAHEKMDPVYILNRSPECVVSTWLDEQGRAISAGLNNVRAEFDANYKMVAVAKVRHGPPADDEWVIATSKYSAELHDAGYQTGLFCTQATSNHLRTSQ